MWAVLVLLALAAGMRAQYHTAPARDHSALKRNEGTSVLPGGRLITPFGKQYVTGPAPAVIAVSPDGRYTVTAGGTAGLPMLSALERVRTTEFRLDHHELAPAGAGPGGRDAPGGLTGAAFADNRTLFVSDAAAGRLREVRLPRFEERSGVDLAWADGRQGRPGRLAADRERGLLYVLDEASSWLVVVDAAKRAVTGSVAVGPAPFDLALSADRRRVLVTNRGLFRYQAIPGADPERAGQTGLPFPAFGFPSLAARDGAARQTLAGRVSVPGLGDPEPHSLTVVNVEDPTRPRVERQVRTGRSFDAPASLGGSGAAGVLAAGGRIFVANAHNDSITVLDAASFEELEEIPLCLPGLETLRGLLPLALAYYQPAEWLLAAEAGLNAVAVIDARRHEVLGHLPAGWFPHGIAASEDLVFVLNGKGQGAGPSATRERRRTAEFQMRLHQGSVSFFPPPAPADLPEITRNTLAMNGFLPVQGEPPALPAAIRHVVLIVKRGRSFDEVLGDVTRASNGPVSGSPLLARFGARGLIPSIRRGRPSRLGLRNVNLTPNHHRIAERWAFSDNFYADSATSAEGSLWLAGAYPAALVNPLRVAAEVAGPVREAAGALHPEQQPEAGSLWHHLERHGIGFQALGAGLELTGTHRGPGLEPAGFRMLANVPLPDPLYRNSVRDYPGPNPLISDQDRADRFIERIREGYLEADRTLPRFLYLVLPNDGLGAERPEEGYPYEASYVADNDYALGRIVEFLSGTPWWREMAIFVTEDSTAGGADSIDLHRTLLLVASPWAKRHYVSRGNTSFPGLLKTIFRLLGAPPLHLFDAAAADLADCFATQPDEEPYEAIRPDPRVFQPEKVSGSRPAVSGSSARRESAGTGTDRRGAAPTSGTVRRTADSATSAIR